MIPSIGTIFLFTLCPLAVPAADSTLASRFLGLGAVKDSTALDASEPALLRFNGLLFLVKASATTAAGCNT